METFGGLRRNSNNANTDTSAFITQTGKKITGGFSEGTGEQS